MNDGVQVAGPFKGRFHEDLVQIRSLKSEMMIGDLRIHFQPDKDAGKQCSPVILDDPLASFGVRSVASDS